MLRVIRAMELCRATRESSTSTFTTNCIIALLSYGTTHKAPPLDSRGFPLSEASVAAKYLVDQGFPVGQILEENVSLDTIGNAYFLRAIHIIPMAMTISDASSNNKQGLQRIQGRPEDLPLRLELTVV
jgi:hypothetical protein